MAASGNSVGIRQRLPVPIQRVLAALEERLGASNLTVPHRWVRRPVIRRGSEVCLFVTYAPRGEIIERNVDHARAWAAANFQVVMIVVVDRLDDALDESELGFAAGILIRQNIGYDFGAWATAINQVPELKTASLVATVNDSIYGPLEGFGAMLDRVRQLDADVIGAIESHELQRHFQSFLIFFKPGALAHRKFWDFWRSVRSGSRDVVIFRYEIRLLSIFEKAGLRCRSLFRSPGGTNRTLVDWRQLVREGFPFVKIAVLKEIAPGDKESDWASLVAGIGTESGQP